MSCLLRLSTPLKSYLKALFSSTNRLRALSDAIFLLPGRCHVGHKNAYWLSHSFFPMISAWLLIAAPPRERPGSSGQTSLVAATRQSVRFARSLATRLKAGQLHFHTCVCPLKWVGGGERACTLVAGTQDVALGIAAIVLGHRLEICEIWRHYISVQEQSRRLLCDAEHVSNCLNNLHGGTSQNMWLIQILPTVGLFFVIFILFSFTSFIHHTSNNNLLCPLTQPSCRCPTNLSL